MKNGPLIANVAALIGDPARANMLTALMDGRALTVSELSEAAGVTLQTASGHLTKLAEADLVVAEKQGRHRYFRLSGADVAATLEQLMSLAQRTGAVRVKTGPKDGALREARICYDHLAGRRGVAMLDAMLAKGLVAATDGATPALTDSGRTFASEFGIDPDSLPRSRRPVCRFCLDWSERRSHLAGALGAAMLERMIDQGWARREEGRVIRFTPSGESAFDRLFAATEAA